MDSIEQIMQDLVEVRLKSVDDDFFKIRETLTRIGVASSHRKVLYQSCHILRKRGLYFILHFKELFKLDGKPSSFNEEDKARRNTITNMLQEWGFLEIVDPSKTLTPICTLGAIKILPFKEKTEWILEAKYQIGKKKINQKFDDLKPIK